MTPAFNKNGKVNKYFDLDEILKLNLSESFKSEFKDKFNKTVSYQKGSGTLVGLEINEKLYEMYYILDSNGSHKYISCENSIKLLK